MKKFMKYLPLAILIFILPVHAAHAQQLKSFSKDTAVFFEQLEEFMYNKEIKKDVEYFLESFRHFIYHETFVADQFDRIVNISNKMLKKRARNYPHFAHYYQCILAFKKFADDTVNYVHWEKALENMLDTRRISISRIDGFLEIINNLVYDNTVYKSATTHWKSDNSNYQIRYENKQLNIYFDDIDLICYAKKDSISIYQTSGVFDPMEIIWKGENGLVTWIRSGFAKDSVNAQLIRYSINMKRSEYEADSVIFTNKQFFDEPLYGILRDKVMNIKSPDDAAFPRFDSYSTRFEIKNLFDDVDYFGGFSLRGARFVGTGTYEKPALVNIYRDIEIIEGTDTIIENILFFTGSSQYYVIRQHGIIGKNTEVFLKMDNDSIYHPGLMFRYDVKRREVSLIRNPDDENLAESPYYNTYHRIDMEFELLSWQIDQPFAEFKMIVGAAVNNAYFQSENFFSTQKYVEVQVIDRVHPYAALYNFSKKVDSEVFYASEYARYRRKSITQIRQHLILLSYSGVIDYDINTEEVRLRERLYHYLEARIGKRDYDVIDFNSQTEGNQINAKLDLTNFDLQIYGVPRIFLSDSQNVIIYPDESKILLQKNLDFDFAGKIEAGLFTFYGQNFSFDYGNFKIDLNKIDSLRLKIIDENLDNWGRQMLVNVKSVIENITGELLIDDPQNKSGVKSFPEYPIFDSKQNSYVYFDKNYIQGGAYPRDKVYFIIDPYQLDSLDNFSTEGLGFEGTFETSGIIPTIREKLVVQDDNSLGFIHRTPPEGFPLYGGKGVFKNDIQISNHGLSGDGSFEFVNSITYSDDFLFYPDSMNAHASQFINEETTIYPEFPEAYGMEVYVHWLPGEEEYFIHSKEEAISMYNTRAKMDGTLKLIPTSLSGDGNMEFDEGVLSSNNFDYKSHLFGADTADFKLKTHDFSGIAYKSDDLNTLVDFSTNTVEFKSNEEFAKIEMPQNKYISYMENFTWYIDRKEIEMATDIYVTVIERGVAKLVEKTQMGSKPLGSLFMSVHPDQDSLNFISPTALFDVNNYIFNAYDVKYIKVADATVFPGDGEVEVHKQAKMQTLQNAEVYANDSTEYHRFYNADVNVFGRLDYSASGDYDYIDELNRKQVISFDMIAVNDSIETWATGKIPVVQNFKLSTVYSYYGNVELQADNQFLTFSGYTRIAHECEKVGRQWFEFTAEINPNEIYLPITSPVENDKNEALYSGVHMAKDSIYVMPKFLTPKTSRRDIELMSGSEGFLYYDKDQKKYLISSMEKLADNDLPGSFVSIDRLYCNLFSEGKIDLGVDLGQVQSELVGNMTFDINKDLLLVDAMMAIDFFFAPQAIQVMADTIYADNFLRPINTRRSTFVKGMKELVGTEMAEQLFDEARLLGQYKKIPDELLHTILLTDVHLKWNQETSSFQSFGKIGIGNIEKTQINKLIDGHIEIQKKRSGDVLSIYLEIDRNNWFFFNYKRGLMQAYASSQQFNEVIRGIKPKKRKMDVPRGEEQYMYFLSNVTRKNQFLRQFEEED